MAHQKQEQREGCTEELLSKSHSLNSTMYIKFFQRHKGDSKPDCNAKFSSNSKLCVALEGGGGEGGGEGRSRLSVLLLQDGW